MSSMRSTNIRPINTLVCTPSRNDIRKAINVVRHPKLFERLHSMFVITVLKLNDSNAKNCSADFCFLSKEALNDNLFSDVFWSDRHAH